MCKATLLQQVEKNLRCRFCVLVDSVIVKWLECLRTETHCSFESLWRPKEGRHLGLAHILMRAPLA